MSKVSLGSSNAELTVTWDLGPLEFDLEYGANRDPLRPLEFDLEYDQTWDPKNLNLKCAFGTQKIGTPSDPIWELVYKCITHMHLLKINFKVPTKQNIPPSATTCN